MEDVDFVKAYNFLAISQVHDSYTRAYSEIVGDDMTPKYFQITVPSSGDAYLSMEFYNIRMYPIGCKSKSSYGSFTLYTSSGTALLSGS